MSFEPRVPPQTIEAIFQPLLGEPLSYMTRYVGCQQFQFGVQRPAKNRRGEDTTKADWIFVVSCDWALASPNGKIVSSDDFGPKRERRDGAALPFYQRLGIYPPYVERVHGGAHGELRLEMTDGIVLTVTPGTPDRNWWSEYAETRSEILREGELWRFFPQAEDADDDPEHWVMTRDALYEPADRDLKRFFDAVFAGNAAKVRALLEQGIRPQQALEEEEYGSTLRYAAIESTPEMVRLLLEYGIGTRENPSVIAAVRSEQLETVRLFLERGGEVNEQNSAGWTPLMEAASWGNLPLVQFLVEHGADVNRQTPQKETAFLVAVATEKTELVDFLWAVQSKATI